MARPSQPRQSMWAVTRSASPTSFCVGVGVDPGALDHQARDLALRVEGRRRCRVRDHPAGVRSSRPCWRFLETDRARSHPVSGRCLAAGLVPQRRVHEQRGAGSASFRSLRSWNACARTNTKEARPRRGGSRSRRRCWSRCARADPGRAGRRPVRSLPDRRRGGAGGPGPRGPQARLTPGEATAVLSGGHLTHVRAAEPGFTVGRRLAIRQGPCSLTRTPDRMHPWITPHPVQPGSARLWGRGVVRSPPDRAERPGGHPGRSVRSRGS